MAGEPRGQAYSVYPVPLRALSTYIHRKGKKIGKRYLRALSADECIGNFRIFALQRRIVPFKNR